MSNIEDQQRKQLEANERTIAIFENRIAGLSSIVRHQSQLLAQATEINDTLMRSHVQLATEYRRVVTEVAGLDEAIQRYA